ncbi:MAG TPA: hypothetical protein ENH34_03880 [Phycisphaerales bacterium]|nr:hypothetical protein [Phycisphaerales bacterium]
MNIFMNFHGFYGRYIIVLLLIACFIVSGSDKNTLAAGKPNELVIGDPFLNFTDVIQKKEKCSKVLMELCDTADVGVIHTFSYYKVIGQVERVEHSQEPLEITKAKILLKGLSDIAWKAIHDEFDAEERIAILKQLVRLEELALKNRPIGAGNVTIANAASLLISGLIFQAVAESEISDLDKLLPFTQRGVLDKHYTKKALKDLLERELKCSPNVVTESRYELLMNAISEKYPAQVEKYKDKKVADLYAELSLLSLSNRFKNQRSQNPLVEIDLAQFTSEFLIVREVEIWARMSPIFRQLREKYKPSKDRQKFISEFKEAFIRNTTAFEKRILGNATAEQEVRKVILDVSSRIRDNLRNKGKEHFAFVYSRYLKLSEDLDIVKE